MEERILQGDIVEFVGEHGPHSEIVEALEHLKPHQRYAVVFVIKYHNKKLIRVAGVPGHWDFEMFRLVEKADAVQSRLRSESAAESSA